MDVLCLHCGSMLESEVDQTLGSHSDPMMCVKSLIQENGMLKGKVFMYFAEVEKLREQVRILELRQVPEGWITHP